MQSLKDKLLKAGLVTEEAARKAEASQRPPRPAHRDTPPRREEPPAGGRLPKFAPLPGSKEASRLQAKRQLELDRQIREKVLAAQVAPSRGDTPFYFVTRKNKLRRFELSAEQVAELERGALAIVERPDPDKLEHALVPADVAQELLALHPKTVRFLKSEGTSVGFLSDAEIAARAGEAPGDDAREPLDEPAADGPPPPAPPEAETWITIKRAPKP